MAMGIFEGHMAKMAEGFKAVRQAEIELREGYQPKKYDDAFRYFDWRKFSDEEFHLCPPVVSVGGDGAMYDIGFQNLSRLMMSGRPIKVLVLDTQVYSNTGGQACTSGFFGQVSDMAQYGKAQQGKDEVRKEIALIAIAHRTTYVLQGAISNITHLLEGFIDGLNARRPALFNIYSPCMPEHGIADDLAEHQSKLAVESRAYPLIRYNPDRGVTPFENLDLEGNPALYQDWPVYTIDYLDEQGAPAKMEVPLTFGDFAVTEARFRKHFRTAPRDTWNENMLPLAEFLELPKDEREGRFPFIWAKDRKNRLIRVMPAEPIVRSAEDRRDFWRILKSLTNAPAAGVSEEQIREQVRAELARNLTARLLEIAGGGNLPADLALPAPVPNGGSAAAAADGYSPPWIDSANCTSCDECIDINPKIFAYDGKKHAFIKDAKGGPYRDIVRAAEKCTAQVIHPGTPWDPKEKDAEKLLARARKYE